MRSFVRVGACARSNSLAVRVLVCLFVCQCFTERLRCAFVCAFVCACARTAAPATATLRAFTRSLSLSFSLSPLLLCVRMRCALVLSLLNAHSVGQQRDDDVDETNALTHRLAFSHWAKHTMQTHEHTHAQTSQSPLPLLRRLIQKSRTRFRTHWLFAVCPSDSMLLHSKSQRTTARARIQVDAAAGWF